jgi:hypothetical protein
MARLPLLPVKPHAGHIISLHRAEHFTNIERTRSKHARIARESFIVCMALTGLNFQQKVRHPGELLSLR